MTGESVSGSTHRAGRFVNESSGSRAVQGHGELLWSVVTVANAYEFGLISRCCGQRQTAGTRQSPEIIGVRAGQRNRGGVCSLQSFRRRSLFRFFRVIGCFRTHLMNGASSGAERSSSMVVYTPASVLFVYVA